MALLDFLTGNNAGKDQIEQANDLMQENIKRLEAIGIPSVDAQKIVLQNPDLAGTLDAEQVGDNAYDQVSTDPRLKQAQMSALEEMSGLGQTGLGTADKAAFNELRRQAAAQAQAEQATVLQGQAARGALDSGQTLVSQLMAGQNQANQLSQQGDRLASAAADARKQALMNTANMASNIRGQDFNAQSAAAQAKNAINQFNAQQRQTTGQYNLGNKQNIANQKAANANQQEIYNKGLLQQNFQNQMAKATGQNTATGNLAANLNAQGQARAQGQANAASGLLGTAAQLGAAYLGGPAAGAVAGAATQAAAPSGNSSTYYKNPALDDGTEIA